MDIETLKGKLAIKIAKYMGADFDEIFLSGNLRDTIKIERIQNGWRVEVPAQRYDIKKFKEEGAVVYTNKGSYASAVDEYGGFSKEHVSYVERAINQAISEWVQEYAPVWRKLQNE